MMSNQSGTTVKKSPKTRSDDAAVYKVMGALALLCLMIVGLRGLRGYYGTVGGMDVIYALSPWIAVAGFVVLAAGIVGRFLVKNPLARALMPIPVAVGLLAGAAGVSMRLYWTQEFGPLYFLCCAMVVQYIILQLYRWEFFFFSLSTASAGYLFFSFSDGFSGSAWDWLTLVVAVAVQVAVVLLSFQAKRHRGVLVLGSRRRVLFPARFSPVLLYIVSAMWLVCIAAVMLLGGLFAYYCMFAAIAVEFIAAVYYTFQLN